MASKLHELQERKGKTWADMKALNDSPNFGDEQRAQWDKLNTELNDIEAQIEAEKASITAASERAKRLAEIEARNREALNDGRVGVDAEKRREDNAERGAHRQDERRALAFQAWAFAQTRSDLREEHRGACQSLSFDPRQKAIVLDCEGRMLSLIHI